MNKKQKISLTISMDYDLYKEITKTAKDIKVSRSQLIEDLVNLGVKAVETDLHTHVIEEYRRVYESN